MSVLKALDNTASKGINTGKSYVKTTRKYYELKVFQQLSLFSSYMVKMVIFGALGALGLIFMAISAAFAIGNYLNSFALGNLFVGLSFFLLGFIIYLSRKAINKWIIQKLSKTYFDA